MENENQNTTPPQSDEEHNALVDSVAKAILSKYIAAFEELAK